MATYTFELAAYVRVEINADGDEEAWQMAQELEGLTLAPQEIDGLTVYAKVYDDSEIDLID